MQVTEQFPIRNYWTNAIMFTAEISCAPDASIGVKIRQAVKWARKSDADLRGAYLSGADLRGAYLSGAYLSGADLSGAYLSGADLSGADLRGADLRGAYLSGADLSGADLRGAYLSGAYLRGAYLSGADLSGAYLSGADLSGADLRGADLRGAYLSGADLSGAYLRGAYLSDAYLRHIKADFFMILALGHREVQALINALREGRVDGSTYSGECACLVGTLENAGASDLPHVAHSPAEIWFAPIRKGIKPGDDNEGGFRAAEALEWALEYAARTGLTIERATA